MSQNNWITCSCVLFNCRDGGWTGPDTLLQDLSWQRLIHNWSDAELRLVLQATADTAPTATNLRRWGVSEGDPACILRGQPATLRHVLNGCPVALHQGRYTWRHNSVLSTIRHRLNTFWEQRSTQLAVQTTVSTKEKARYIQFVRTGRRLPAPSNVTQCKPLASQAILLQANDWTFLFDLEGQLQFQIEADVTSLRPDVVLSSCSSKTIVLLELTVPLEDNVHLTHDRKISKYSASVTACEENGFKTHMLALEVRCLGYCLGFCPHSFLHCFEALGLPKSAARQIRSEASKPLFVHRMYFSSQRHANLWVSSCSLLNHGHVAIVSFRCFFFVCVRVFISFAISVSHRFHPETTRSISKHTRNTPRFSISPNVRRTLYSMRTPVFSRASFRSKITEQPVGCALSLLRYVDSTMRVPVVDWWISVSNLQLAALTF